MPPYYVDSAETFLNTFNKDYQTKSESEPQLNTFLEDHLKWVAKFASSKQVTIAKNRFVSGCLWLDIEAYEKSTLNQIEGWCEKTGINNVITFQNSIGIVAGGTLAQNAKLRSLTSFAVYFSVIRDSRLQKRQPDVVYFYDKSILVNSDDHYYSDPKDLSKTIHTYIVEMDDGCKSSVSFFSDGSLNYIQDLWFEKHTEMNSIIRELNEQIIEFATELNQRGWHQRYYFLKPTDDAFLPLNKNEAKKLRDTMHTQKRSHKQRIYISIGVGIALLAAGYFGYTAYNESVYKKEAIAREMEIRRVKLKAEKERIENLKSTANLEISRASLITPIGEVINTAIKNLLILPKNLSGQNNEKWLFQNWSCISLPEKNELHDVTQFRCAFSYSGEPLASSQFFENWTRSFATSKYAPRNFRLDDIVGPNGGKSGKTASVSYDFSVQKNDFNHAGNKTADELQTSFSDLIDISKNKGFDFTFDDFSTTDRFSPNGLEGAKELAKIQPLVVPMFSKGFTIKGAIGTLGASIFSLPDNSMITKISGEGGAGDQVTIKGFTKYEKDYFK